MTDPTKFAAGRASADLATNSVDHDQLASKVWAGMYAAIEAAKSNPSGPPIGHLLKGMKETHGSLRAIYTAATKIEETGEKTGRWVDMLLLARAQYDAVFVGLLIAHDEPKWGTQYRKAGWAASAIRHFFVARRYRKTDAGERLRRNNIPRLKKHARFEGVTAKEWSATTAEIRGVSIRRGATMKDAIKPLPTPGQVIQGDLLKGGKYENLSRLLWQQWKFLCDPAHSGIATIWARYLLRGEGDLPADKREEFIQGYVVGASLVPSLVAINTLTTVLAVEHRSDPDLCAKVIQAWDLIEKGTIEGSIVWDGWAKQAMGALG